MSNEMIKKEEDIKAFFEDYNWSEAWSIANFSKARNDSNVSTEVFEINDIEVIISSDEGCNDGDNWIMIGKVKDGRFFFLSAGCDYTGWSCQAWNNSFIDNSIEDLIRYGMDDSDRSRLNAEALLIHLEKEKLEEVIEESSKSNASMKI